MDLSVAEVDGLPELAAERVGEGEDAGFGFERETGAETVRTIGDERVLAVVLVPAAVGKQEEVRILVEQETPFDRADGVRGGVDRFFVEAAQCFQSADAEQLVAE